MQGITGLHIRDVLRNPWVWPAGLAVLLLGFAFSAQQGAVGLVSLVATLQLYVPPLLLIVAIPLLTRREVWAFWAARSSAPGRAFVAASLGIGFAVFLPLLIGTTLAGFPLALSVSAMGLLVLALALLVTLWTALAALLAAITMDATRALALGFALWALGTLAYGPAVVGLAVNLPDRPLFGLLSAALLTNPAEGIRVGLLEVLDVPVLVGPIALLLRDTLPGPTLAWGALSSVAWSALAGIFAAASFARRDR